MGSIKQAISHIKHVCKSAYTDYRRPTYQGIRRYGANDTWIPDFISKKMGYSHPSDIACFTVNTYPEIIKWNRHPHKLLYIAENVHVPYSHWALFADIHHQSFAPDLTIGFDYDNSNNYIRFPYWIVNIFSPLATHEQIKTFVEQYNYSHLTNRTDFCAFICRYDYFGDRALMADIVESVAPLSYPSDFRHNDDRMRIECQNNKIAYLNAFRFNLCPENSNNAGYVTEKIFHAVKAGCVPIYWGNEGVPETNILNKDAIIYLDREHPEDAVNLIKLLQTNPQA